MDFLTVLEETGEELTKAKEQMKSALAKANELTDETLVVSENDDDIEAAIKINATMIETYREIDSMLTKFRLVMSAGIVA